MTSILESKTAPVVYKEHIDALSDLTLEQVYHDIQPLFVDHVDAPRKEIWFADKEYTYGSGRGRRTYPPTPMNACASMGRIMPAVNGELFKLGGSAWRVNSCFVNCYDTQHQHLGWHADDSPEMDDSQPIAIWTIGAERKIAFRPKGVKGEAHDELLLNSNSLVVMLPGMQLEWDHKIPKHWEPCGPRISFTFRNLI
ncbi:MAG: alpha-ketoglutarate-dependent dioxygenase AlkB [Natronospirillum sp.]|uniref:alpha-ketoglutarate-dependent dioxygenase AlkB n=1 Tax=Natronospirillum sp. TaxID=2812955 RepID=UPI0025EDB70B|nr:alpha-ketoglutarate-dependent dioxygenase AlkB [Natronospirillum sp.]MCH8552927.1 alpha-ketoglutarate-dependent dioxygenase AlkB [Natronospirillum sp.]